MLRTTDVLNVRAAPTVDAPIIASLSSGHAVTPADSRAWRAIILPDRRTGWVAADFLAADDSAPAGAQLVYDPTFPLQLQRQDWTCSIRTTQMILSGVGVLVDAGELQDLMTSRGLVNSDVGLTDGSGRALAAFIRERFQLPAFSMAADFADVMEFAGARPLGIGLHNWGNPGGHWSAVRGRYVDRSYLILANPAGTGPRFGQQTLARDEFNMRGPCHMVYLDWPD